jgi:hypothetical protein
MFVATSLAFTVAFGVCWWGWALLISEECCAQAHPWRGGFYCAACTMALALLLWAVA